jgi:hypothetical protein
LIDDFYLGATELSGKELYPAWIPVFEKIFPTRLHIGAPIVSLNCALGCGKTTVSTMMASMIEARIDHLDNQKFLRGMAAKTLGLGLAHKKLDKVSSDFIKPLNDIKEVSPYWKKNRVSHNRVDYKAGGEHNISSMLGGDLIGAVLSEINFWKYHKAKYAVESMIGRLNARFIHAKEYFTLLVLDSSPSDTGVSVVNDFLEQNPDIYSVEMSIWKAKAHKNQYFNEGKFYVFTGDQSHDPFILSDGVTPEQLPSEIDKDKVIEVPEELRREFTINTERALRDQAGITTMGFGGSFFKDKDRLERVFSLPHYNKDLIEVDFYNTEDRLIDHLEESLKLLPKEKIIYLRFDIGVVNDLTGLSIGYFDEYSFPFGEDNKKMKEPNFIINTVAGISRKPGQETSITKLKDLVIELDKRYEIGGVSCDMYQSRQLLQDLQQLGIKTKYISVDRTNTAYNYAKNAIYTGRVKLPASKWLKTELKSLQYIDGKINHIAPGSEGTAAGGGRFSKDIADSFTGLLYHMYEDLEYASQLSNKYTLKRQSDMIESLKNINERPRNVLNKSQHDMISNIF